MRHLKAIFVLIAVVLLSLLFASCKKDTGQCYYCTFGQINGTTPAPQSYCGEPNRQFRDNQGNSLPSSCSPK